MNRWSTLAALSCVVASMWAVPTGSRAEAPGVEIAIRNVSSFYSYSLRVKDEVCTGTTSQECLLAEHLLESEECAQDKRAEACRKARALIDDGVCVRGLVYRGTLGPGEGVNLTFCPSSNGSAQVAVSKDGGPWVSHSWLEAGEVLEVR